MVPAAVSAQLDSGAPDGAESYAATPTADQGAVNAGGSRDGNGNNGTAGQPASPDGCAGDAAPNGPGSASR
jgi:hypothetical protein